MDAKTGGVVALASWPTYDPRWFVHGLTQDEACFRDSRRVRVGGADPAPLFDRAYQEVYLPGFDVQAVHRARRREGGYASPRQRRTTARRRMRTPVIDRTRSSSTGRPSIWATCRSREALKISCDTVFYQWGADFYDRYARPARGRQRAAAARSSPWGFGPTGHRSPGRGGRLHPRRRVGRTSRRRRPIFRQNGWLPGDDILMSIGQGYVRSTPLQLAPAYAAIANGGHLCRPHVAEHIETTDGERVKQIDGRCDRPCPTRSSSSTDPGALRQVPVSGTAAPRSRASRCRACPVAGKTGTAVPRRQHVPGHSWFAAMVPAPTTQYVVVAMVEQAGFGSDVGGAASCAA